MTDKVIDYAWSSGFPNAKAIRDAGFVGVMRYLSHDAAKDLSPAERDDLRANGLSIGLIFESIANRAAQGRDAGVIDGAFANQRANALGYPDDCTLWYAVDFDATVTQVQPYFDGVASVGGRRSAPYGSFAICEGVRCGGVPWQTIAWSHGKRSTRAGLLQNVFGGTTGRYDSNDVLIADYGQWSIEPEPQPEDDMALFDSIEAFRKEVRAALPGWQDGSPQIFDAAIGVKVPFRLVPRDDDKGTEGSTLWIFASPGVTVDSCFTDTDGNDIGTHESYKPGAKGVATKVNPPATGMWVEKISGKGVIVVQLFSPEGGA